MNYLGSNPVKIIRRSRNLIPFPYYIKNGTTINGITAKVNADGSILLNGTATGKASFTLMYRSKERRLDFTGEHTLSLEGGYFVDGKGVRATATVYNGDTDSYVWLRGEPTKTYTYLESQGITEFLLVVDEGIVLDNFLAKPMFNEGNTALPYEPYNQLWRVRSGAMIRNPKNLLSPTDGTKVLNGITCLREKGVIKISGTMLADKSFENIFPSPTLEIGKTYTYSLNSTSYAGGVAGFISQRDKNGNWIRNLVNDKGSGCKLTVTEDMYKDGGYLRFTVYMYAANATTYDFTCTPILNEGDTAEPFYVQD